MLVDRVGQLAVLVLSDQRVVDDRPIGALLVELGRSVAKVGRVPEARPDLLALADDLLLLHQLGEQDVEGDDRHTDQDSEHRPGDDHRPAERGPQAVGVVSGWGGSGCCELEK
jgi:hypothetical protein